MSKVKQGQTIIYMRDFHSLVDEIDNLVKSGFEITSVVRLRDFKYPDLGVNPVTDWLIIFKDND